MHILHLNQRNQILFRYLRAKEKKKEGSSEKKGGWKFTHFTSPGSAPGLQVVTCCCRPKSSLHMTHGWDESCLALDFSLIFFHSLSERRSSGASTRPSFWAVKNGFSNWNMHVDTNEIKNVAWDELNFYYYLCLFAAMMWTWMVFAVQVYSVHAIRLKKQLKAVQTYM